MATRREPAAVGTHWDGRTDVVWFDRAAGIGVLALPGGEECVVQRCDPDAAVADVRCGGHQHRWPAARTHAQHPSATGPKPDGWWRALRPSLTEAERAGTWGDGGRDL